MRISMASTLPRSIRMRFNIARDGKPRLFAGVSALDTACELVARHWRVTMPKNYVFAMKFAKVYPLYVAKAEGKNRTKAEVDQIIRWLTGYDQAGLRQQINQENDLETFFAQAPAIHPNASLIKGVVCGVR